MKFRVALFLLLAASSSANAQWLFGGGYYNLSDEEGNLDVSLGALVASVGYQFPTENNFSFIPELRIGTGVGDDNVFGAKVEVDHLVAVALRGQFDFASGMYLFAAPAYGDFEIKASGGGSSASDSGSEFGVGGGVGFHFNNTLRGELSYETFDGTDVFGVAFKFALKN